jgi:hypothetical protein
LDAQRAAITGYLTPRTGELVAEYVEVESGKVDGRPKLREALGACQRLGARLIIAKLDRLSRDVAFIANLMRSNADFIVCDYPDANRLTLHIMALKEDERGAGCGEGSWSQAREAGEPHPEGSSKRTQARDQSPDRKEPAVRSCRVARDRAAAGSWALPQRHREEAERGWDADSEWEAGSVDSYGCEQGSGKGRQLVPERASAVA